MACNFIFIVKSDGVLKVTAGSHVYFRICLISKTALDSDILTTCHKQELIYGLSNCSNCDNLVCDFTSKSARFWISATNAY